MPQTILLVGAGKSTAYLLQYLLKRGAAGEIRLIVADQTASQLPITSDQRAYCDCVDLDIFQTEDRQKLIQKATVVVSMLPARMHILVAQDCLHYGKHLVTASYVSKELRELDQEVKKKGLVFMNEVGLDPGIDHMSAMQVIDRIRSQGGKMLLFESFTGGLVAPINDNNLWHYKFSWNPRNVVVAGQGGAAKFLQEGTYKYIPYHKLFRRTEFLEIDGYGRFEVYANRDSLSYQEAYGLRDVLTLFRGTMRRVGFSKAWNIFIQLGMTDDSYQIENSEGMTYRDYVNLFLPYSPTDSVELKLRHYLKIDQDDILWDKLLELDLFSIQKTVRRANCTPAQALQEILERSWTLEPDEKDMIAMYHKFGFELNGEKRQIDAHMVVLGKDQRYTAMAKTVGLPAAMVAMHILEGRIKTPGVQIPLAQEVYDPVLTELADHGIVFTEKEVPYLGYNLEGVGI
ncbi:saccharopine dehydrogenase family protein [Aureicoccus marinus]|uniref:Saccharopine dehydrogenase n=1 Tax=Aureicoccus marinus TaxID=754435 RepID=A0A2S7TAA6_9FLAO|nr:saccharopine dehydrogenase family protein [Aureicoccus marinus]PQJ16445.1 saccharopine dehydrogenase [Aureicoccus marinus]